MVHAMFPRTAAFFVIVTYMDTSTLYCAHEDLFQSQLEATPFCIITGVDLCARIIIIKGSVKPTNKYRPVTMLASSPSSLACNIKKLGVACGRGYRIHHATPSIYFSIACLNT